MTPTPSQPQNSSVQNTLTHGKTTCFSCKMHRVWRTQPPRSCKGNSHEGIILLRHIICTATVVPAIGPAARLSCGEALLLNTALPQCIPMLTVREICTLLERNTKDLRLLCDFETVGIEPSRFHLMPLSVWLCLVRFTCLYSMGHLLPQSLARSEGALVEFGRLEPCYHSAAESTLCDCLGGTP